MKVWLLALLNISVLLGDTVNAGSVPPPVHRGLYAIWYARMPEVLDLPYITGGQVVMQWGELEKAEGQYDFRPLAAQCEQLSAQRRPFTVQVNGNIKPAWLFERVPYLPEKLDVQVRDARGTLMYWHPTFKRAYLNFLRAYTAFLKQSPYRSLLVGVRQNFNAIGTEHWEVPGNKSALSYWHTPPGAEPGTPFTPMLARTYQNHVLETFVREFAPDIRVFVRNSIQSDLRQAFNKEFQTGHLCWFHTSSEMEPRNKGGKQYHVFLDDCRTGHTLAYAEPWASAWGHHDRMTDPRWCSPPQWNYWRLLCDLNCGVSFIACYANDLAVAHSGRYPNGNVPAAEAVRFKEEFDAAFRFAAKYAGYHASPEVSPGAWVALRQGSALEGDYTFLMNRLPDHSREAKKAGPDDQRFGAWARLLPGTETMRFVLDQTFAASLNAQTTELRVTYLDQGTGAFEVKAGDQKFTTHCTNTGRWKTTLWNMPPALYKQDDSGAQVSLQALDADLILHMLEVVRNTDVVQARDLKLIK